MRRMILLIPALLAVGACVSNLSSPAPQDAAEAVTLAEPPILVTGICGDCHAVTANALSPNPQAPGFADIANSPGVTRIALVAFLSDAHNYPLQMDVDLAAEDIEQIADHMMTLKSEDYTRPPS